MGLEKLTELADTYRLHYNPSNFVQINNCVPLHRN